LEHIARTDLRNTEVIVSEDARPRPDRIETEIKEVLRRFNFPYIQRHNCKQNWDNIYRCLHDASSREFIYAIEDDQIVEPDFIRWHQQAQAQFEPFISCGESWSFPPSDNPAEVGLSHSDSLIRGCCMSGKNLRNILNQGHEYHQHFEELAQKRLIKEKLLSIFPTMPRSHDLNVAGVNLGEFKPLGTLDEKIAQLRDRVRLRNPRTQGELVIGCDRRDRWEKAYVAQSKWGFD
jgi:hypothetical protein